MNAPRDPLRAFAAADLRAWPGLPSGLRLAEVEAVFAVDHELAGTGTLGAERRPAAWVAAESDVYEGGLRVWHEDARVLVLEGRDPLDGDRKPLVAPELGEADAVLDTVLGPLVLPGGERVYSARGLALRVNPENGLALGVLGFAPTDAGEYVARLRVELAPRRLLAEAGCAR